MTIADLSPRPSPKAATRFVFLLACLALCGIARAAFWDSHLASGAARTEFPPGYGVGQNFINLWYAGNGLPGAEGCLWSASDPLASFFRCPGRRGESSVWRANLQEREACGGSTVPIGDSWLGCLAYSQDNYFALNAPGAHYWLIHANTDPAFDQCRKGPPGISHPIVDPIALPTTPNLYKVAMENTAGGRKTMHIIVAPWEHDFHCPGYTGPFGGDGQYQNPYLSIGAHADRGNGEPIARIDPSGGSGPDILRFNAQIRGWGPMGCAGGAGDPCTVPGAHAGVLIAASWHGVRRMLFVDLYNEGVYFDEGPATAHWSWPLADSTFWPGGEVVVISASRMATACPDVGPLSVLTKGASGTAGSRTSYALPMSRLFKCASERGWFTSTMPMEPVPIEFVDWFVEVNGTWGMLWLAIDDPVIAAR